MDHEKSAVSYRGAPSRDRDLWHPMDAIHSEINGMGNALGPNDGAALPAVKRERHGEDRLQCVALGASGRGDISLTARRLSSQVGEALDHIGGDAGTVGHRANQGGISSIMSSCGRSRNTHISVPKSFKKRKY
jgi:hypothetical protein